MEVTSEVFKQVWDFELQGETYTLSVELTQPFMIDLTWMIKCHTQDTSLEGFELTSCDAGDVEKHSICFDEVTLVLSDLRPGYRLSVMIDGQVDMTDFNEVLHWPLPEMNQH